MNGTTPWAFLICPTCGRAPLPLAAAGDEATCPGCGRLLHSPAPASKRRVPVSVVRPVPVSTVPSQVPAAAMDSSRRPTGFRCPYCGTEALPIRCSEVAREGWEILMLLVAGVATIPLCWLGLLVRESYHRCVGCGIRFG